MKKPKSRSFLVTAAIACVLMVSQVIALIRYVGRLPDDWVGIVIHTVTMIAFAIVAIGFFIRWKKGKREEAKNNLNNIRRTLAVLRPSLNNALF